MKNVLVIALLGAIGWFGYDTYKFVTTPETAVASNFSTDTDALKVTPTPAPVEKFHCDGRTYCSQMHSCAEAIYFVQHCPNTKMDGDNDGLPCEQQWCQ